MYIYTYVRTICTMYEKSALSVLLSNKFKWVGCCLLLYTTVLIQVYEKKIVFSCVFSLPSILYRRGKLPPTSCDIWFLSSFISFLSLAYFLCSFFLLYFIFLLKLQIAICCSKILFRIWTFRLLADMNEWVGTTIFNINIPLNLVKGI